MGSEPPFLAKEASWLFFLTCPLWEAQSLTTGSQLDSGQ